MELAAVARVLRRRRRLVAVGLLVAVAGALLAVCSVSLQSLSIESRRTHGGEALARVLVDTGQPLAGDARSRGAGTIAARAVLLGALMTAPPARAAIAEEMGTKLEVEVSAPGFDQPAAITPLAERAVGVTGPRERMTVALSGDPAVPVLSIVARAGSPEAAARLATATTSVLEARSEDGSGDAPIRIEALGPPIARPVSSGPGPVVGVGVGVLIFVLWCALVAALPAARIRRRSPGFALSRPRGPSPAPVAPGGARDGGVGVRGA